MLLALGLFCFDIPTLAHDELQRRCDYQHARSPRIGARDATQYVGPGEDKISVSGRAMAELSDGAASLDQLRDMAATGNAWALVDGAGRVFGAYVIVNVDERQSVFLPDGTARQISFGIELTRVDDPAQAST